MAHLTTRWKIEYCFISKNVYDIFLFKTILKYVKYNYNNCLINYNKHITEHNILFIKQCDLL